MMRGRTLRTAVLCLVLLVFVAFVADASASATTVTVMGADGSTRQVNNPYLGEAGLGPVPIAPAFGTLGYTATYGTAATGTPAATPDTGPAGRTLPASTKKKKKQPPVTVRSRLAAMQKSGAITATVHAKYLKQFDSALTEEQQIASWRSAQLADVTELLHELAVGGQLSAARLPVLFETLERNVQYWRSGASLVYPDRVQFKGSDLVWEYYPGYGLQLQVLGTFGEADGYYEAGKQDWPQLLKVLKEMRQFAVYRGGALTWEYYFNWEGGSPPWVSAMAQGTGLEALANAYKATGRKNYVVEGNRMLKLFTTSPPTGVGESTDLGRRYLQYSFAPSTYIINAFLQTLIGLDHFTTATGSKTAEQLFNSGNREAEHELPQYVVGGWSLYQPGELDDYSYHVLVTGFAKQLCSLTGAKAYCDTYDDFEDDLTSAPKITQTTHSIKTGRSFLLRFQLSQVSDVGAIVTGPSGKDHLYTSAELFSGSRAFTTPALKSGTYAVTLTATDMAGRRTQIHGTLTACKKGHCNA